MELRAHQATHGADATLGPYRPYRDWPLKPNAEEGKTVVPGDPFRKTTNIEKERVHPVTGGTLAPL
jgi:hypothetical protein